MKFLRIPTVVVIAVSALILTGQFNKVHAATCTWNGSVDGNWATAANWDAGCTGVGGIPGDGDGLVFPASAGNLTNTNDIVGLGVLSITAADPGYNINLGNINLGVGGISATADTVSYDGNITLIANSSFSNTTNFYAMTGGTINLNGFDLTFDTGSTITITADISGTGDIIKTGVSSINLLGTNTFAGSIIINQGSVEAIGGSAIPNDACVSVASGTTVTINTDSEIMGCLSGAGTVELEDGADLEINETSSTTFSGVFTEVGAGTVGVSIDGPNVLTYTGGTSAIDGIIIMDDGTLIADGTNGGDFSAAATTVLVGGTLELTNGITMGSVSSSGTIILDEQSTITSTGLDSNGTTQVIINSSSAFGTVDVTGLVAVSGTLSLTGSYAPALSDSFILVNNDGADAVTGTFSGLAEGASINFNGGVFSISYVGGDGNDIELTVVTPAVTYTTTTALTSSVNPTVQDQCTVFTATVDSNGGPTPTGNVSFYRGATLLGTDAVNGSGVATLSVCNLGLGNHNITAVYAGNGINLTSTSEILVQQVRATLADTGAEISREVIMSTFFFGLIGFIVVNKRVLFKDKVNA